MNLLEPSKTQTRPICVNDAAKSFHSVLQFILEETNPKMTLPFVELFMNALLSKGYRAIGIKNQQTLELEL